MKITFDPIKRAKTLADRGLDFADAQIVFEGVTVEIEDLRMDYGEPRILCFGLLEGRIVVVGYTPRGETRHVFSMRKANEREKKRIAPLFQV
ncbi:MAG: BrnT family toxin [Burkholderiales bacterium]|nr:BrnT family toxin [Nitrosomonadaceae bacterium]